MALNTNWVQSKLELASTNITLYRHRTQQISSNELNQKPAVLMLHGMHDVALSLAPVAEQLLPSFRPVLMDLRGHGNSGHPGAYSMEHHLFDLHQVVDHLSLAAPATLFGHSLGGQIVARFSGVWPQRVHSAVVVEGLGPPAVASALGTTELEAQEVAQYAMRLQQTMGLPSESRALPDVEFAASRLQRNNHRLSADQALELAAVSTRHNAAGDLVWSFDPRVAAVFIGVSESQGAVQWRQSIAPTLIIQGGLSHEYWASRVARSEDWTGKYQPGEYAARAANFRNHELLYYANAGHMVHYDEPEQLGLDTLNFLERQI